MKEGTVMSWGSTEPPIEPREGTQVECRDCEGLGVLQEVTHGILVRSGVCETCDGSGLIDFDPDDNPYAPDTWKEAEGIA